MVWLSAKDLPLRVKFCNLAPHFVGRFPVSKKVNPAAVRLNPAPEVPESSPNIPCGPDQTSEGECADPSL